jgi:hypothetical protein
MRIALPVWNTMISPVLDTARTLRIISIEGTLVTGREDNVLPAGCLEKAEAIAEQSGILICGAVSCCLEQELVSRRVTVYAWIMGESETIISAYLTGQLHDNRHIMPGCGRWRQGGRHQCSHCGSQRERHTRRAEP